LAARARGSRLALLRRPARLALLVGAALVVALIAGRALVGLYTEALWFDEVGYTSVYWTRLRAIIGVRLATGVLAGAIVLVNLFAVVRHLGPVHLRRRYGNLEISEQVPRLYVRGGVLVAAILAGVWLSGIAFPGPSALAVLAWANRSSWGIADPLFGRDLSFYVFSLPIYAQLLDYMLLVLVWSLLLTVIGYVLVGAVRIRDNRLEIDEHPRLHFAFLLTALVLVFAARYWLGRYGILLEGSGFSNSVGYTDVHARLPAHRVMAVLSVAAGAALLFGAIRRVWWPPAVAVGVLIVAGIGLGYVYPSFIQQLRVEPNELERERPYIGWNLEFTRAAYDLDALDTVDFVPRAAGLRGREPVGEWLDRLPLWDVERLREVFNQRQAFRGYYHFPNVDVDRYGRPGEEHQVAIAVREFDREGLQPESRTWRTRHLNAGQVRGYGAVLTPTAEKSPGSGDPVYWLRDLSLQASPSAPPSVELSVPEIYFGESMDDYVIAGPAADTLPPSADLRLPGIPLTSFLRVFAFAWRFPDRNLLFAGDLTDESRLIFRRPIRDRVAQIAPFVIWDRDPYPVIAGGRLQWVIDGYSASSTFPIAAPYDMPGVGVVRYLKNTVKATVDGFTGEIALYLLTPDEPVIAAYDRIFPGLFRRLATMEPEIQQHLRYPASYLRVQADILEEYHVRRPEVFYSGQDAWQIPQAAGGQGAGGYQPQYLTMQLPGEQRAEFLLTLPFIARERQNMTAILIARNDAGRYGEKVLLRLPRDAQALGPAQVNAIIEQDARIAPQLTMLRSQGSNVDLGRVRVLPLDSALLYVQPLILIAAGGTGSSGSTPQLPYVIVSDGSAVAFGTSLRAALDRLYDPGDAPLLAGLPLQLTPSTLATGSVPARALALFEEAERRLRSGDWNGFGQAWNELEQLLRQLAEEPGRD
jgi:hypothetical protein